MDVQQLIEFIEVLRGRISVEGLAAILALVISLVSLVRTRKTNSDLIRFETRNHQREYRSDVQALSTAFTMTQLTISSYADIVNRSRRNVEMIQQIIEDPVTDREIQHKLSATFGKREKALTAAQNRTAEHDAFVAQCRSILQAAWDVDEPTPELHGKVQKAVSTLKDFSDTVNQLIESLRQQLSEESLLLEGINEGYTRK